MFLSIPFAAIIEAQALLDDGFLDILVDLSKVDEYWGHMLQEYPEHPASANHSRSIPIMLYGHLQNCSSELEMVYRVC